MFISCDLYCCRCLFPAIIALQLLFPAIYRIAVIYIIADVNFLQFILLRMFFYCNFSHQHPHFSRGSRFCFFPLFISFSFRWTIECIRFVALIRTLRPSQMWTTTGGHLRLTISSTSDGRDPDPTTHSSNWEARSTGRFRSCLLPESNSSPYDLCNHQPYNRDRGGIHVLF